MGKRTVYTKITPLPSNIPRQLALDMLHSHIEVIKLNPLVTGVKPVDAPRNAAQDEFFSQWYEINQTITWGFGVKGNISFKGVFHDQPWGMQSHVYAPMGVDMRNKYRIGGNQPGEPKETRELGVDTPQDGLYLREDVEIVCNVPLTMSFVKKEAKAATAIMVQRLTRKAELLDEGKLHAMFEDGKLKTAKPSGAPTFTDRPLPSPSTIPGSPLPLGSPGLPSRSTFGTEFQSPAVDEKGYGTYRDLMARQNSQAQRQSTYIPQYQQQGYSGPDYARTGAELAGVPEMNELPGSFYQPEQHSPSLYPPPLKSQGQVFRSELPGDSTYIPTNASANTQPAETSQTYQQPGAQPPSQYQAYQQQNLQPHPSPGLSQSHSSSPGLPSRQGSNGSSNYSGGQNYRVSNPDVRPPQQQHPAHRQHSSAHSGQVADWQRGLALNFAEEPNAIRNSTHSSQYNEPDHQRFSMLSIQHTPMQHHAQPIPTGPGGVSKCPVCSVFEGDEAAVSHHVSKAHFA